MLISVFAFLGEMYQHFHLPEGVPVCPIGDAVHKVVHLPPDAPGKQSQVCGVSDKCPHLPVVGVLSADVRVVVAVGAGQQLEHLVILRVRGVKPGGLVPGVTHHLNKRYCIKCSQRPLVSTVVFKRIWEIF